MRRLAGRKIACSSALLFALALSACGDDAGDEDKAAPSGGTGGSTANPSAGRGGSAGAAGASGRGGNLPRANQDANAAAYMCTARPEDTGGSSRAGTACCSGLGTCANPENGEVSSSMPRDICSTQAELRCAPNEPPAQTSDVDAGAVATSGFRVCRVKFPGAPADFPDYEGRCLPTCFVQHSEFAARLSGLGCESGQTCSPCYSPLTGESTGTCDLFGDAPSDPAPAGFEDCADGLGYCVPQFAAGMQASQLMRLSCKSGELCGPKNKVADPRACFPRCEAGAFGPGACVPTFLTAGLSAFLTPADCASGAVCAPCSVLNMRTGVCD